ncbi:MAG: hypothetical protein AAB588_05115 [Patescibacteria group bacterium]
MADNTNQNPATGNQGGTIDLRQLPPTQAGAAAGGSSATPPASGASTTSAGATGDQSVFNKFEIPETVRQQFPELIPLVLATESMNDEERQYWFQILPIMTQEQVAKLREILANEKKQLEKLDKDYKEDIKEINQKHVAEWKEFEAKEKRQKLKAEETKAESTEQEEEEALLKNLQNL